MDSGGEDGFVLPKESACKILARHAEERAELKKKSERIRSFIPKKDRASRARAAEEAAEEEKLLLQRQTAECDDNGITEEAIAKETSNLTLSSESQQPNANSLNEPQEKESKAARRRRKKAEKEAEARQRIEEEKANMGPSPKFTEMQAIDEQLKPKGLRIHAIPADGHCLYSAVAHQMNLTECVSPVEASVQGLRTATAKYLLSHKAEFMPFIESLNEDDSKFRQYCDQLENEAVWGGHVELNALSQVLGSRIEIYAANMLMLQIGDESSKIVLRLSFHRQYYSLGEHYNSIVQQT